MSKVKIFSGSQKQILEITVPINAGEISGQSNVPSLVYRGIITGWSLPVWNSNQEQLFADIHVPHRYDGASDIMVHVSCYLAGAEDDHAFKLQLSWEHYCVDCATVPSTSNDVEVETETGGTASQFKPFEVNFTLDYDIDGGGSEIISDELLHLRLRRIAETGGKDEIDAELVITHIGADFHVDNLGENV